MTDILLEQIGVGDTNYSPYVSDGTDGFTHGNWIVWNGSAWEDTLVSSTLLKSYATDQAGLPDGTYYLLNQ